MKTSNFKNTLYGALKGGLITGGLGFGIPATYGLATDRNTLGAATRFGLLSAIPGALMGAILSNPTNHNELQHPKLYNSPKDDLIYEDLLNYYSQQPDELSSEDFIRLYSR